jgi:hypothetical protein
MPPTTNKTQQTNLGDLDATQVGPPPSPLVPTNKPTDLTAEEPITASRLPPPEKFKIYLDLYKFYCELPFKIGAAYSVCATLIFLLITRITTNETSLFWSAVFLLILSAVIGVTLFVIEDKYVSVHQSKIENLMQELDIEIGPNISILKWIMRLSVLFFILPLLLAVVLYFEAFN